MLETCRYCKTTQWLAVQISLHENSLISIAKRNKRQSKVSLRSLVTMETWKNKWALLSGALQLAVLPSASHVHPLWLGFRGSKNLNVLVINGLKCPFQIWCSLDLEYFQKTPVAGEASQRIQESACLLSPSTEVPTVYYHPGLWNECWGSTLHPHAFAATTWLTEPFPQQEGLYAKGNLWEEVKPLVAELEGYLILENVPLKELLRP